MLLQVVSGLLPLDFHRRFVKLRYFGFPRDYALELLNMPSYVKTPPPLKTIHLGRVVEEYILKTISEFKILTIEEPRDLKHSIQLINRDLPVDSMLHHRAIQFRLALLGALSGYIVKIENPTTYLRIDCTWSRRNQIIYAFEVGEVNIEKLVKVKAKYKIHVAPRTWSRSKINTVKAMLKKHGVESITI